MNMDRPAYLLIVAAALILSGCGGGAEKAGGERITTTAAAGAASPSPAADGRANAAPPAADSSPSPTAEVDAARQGSRPVSATSGASNASPAKVPKPQIGSGGNDLFVFTQARGAINSDPDLKAANVVVEVKEGIVTLSGTVASAALKSKAEQLARGTGPKDVRNQLRISAAH
jgi:hyperosmotically inducible protein